MPKAKASDLPGMRTVTLPDLVERAKNTAKKPKETDFKGKKGYRRFHEVDGVEKAGEAPDGTYQWAYKPGRGDAVADIMKPWAEAETARVAKQNQAPGEYFGKRRRPTSVYVEGVGWVKTI